MAEAQELLRSSSPGDPFLDGLRVIRARSAHAEDYRGEIMKIDKLEPATAERHRRASNARYLRRRRRESIKLSCRAERRNVYKVAGRVRLICEWLLVGRPQAFFRFFEFTNTRTVQSWWSWS